MGKQDDFVLAIKKSDLQAVVKLLGKYNGSKSSKSVTTLAGGGCLRMD